MELNEDQKRAVDGAVNNQFIFSITGSAGTGKSTVIKAIYETLCGQGKRVSVLAPTGRASNLLRTKMGHGETIHRFLGYFSRDNGDSYIPRFTRDNPITDTDVVIVDEDHPIFMRAFQGELRPYVHVRFGINALIQRAAFFHLVEMGELSDDAEGQAKLSLQSGDLLLQLGT